MDQNEYQRRMQKADNIQKAGTDLMKIGCGFMVLVFLFLFFLIAIIGAVA